MVSFEARQVFLFSTFGVPDFVSFKDLSSAKTTVILCGKSQGVCDTKHGHVLATVFYLRSLLHYYFSVIQAKEILIGGINYSL